MPEPPVGPPLPAMAEPPAPGAPPVGRGEKQQPLGCPPGSDDPALPRFPALPDGAGSPGCRRSPRRAAVPVMRPRCRREALHPLVRRRVPARERRPAPCPPRGRRKRRRPPPPTPSTPRPTAYTTSNEDNQGDRFTNSLDTKPLGSCHQIGMTSVQPRLSAGVVRAVGDEDHDQAPRGERRDEHQELQRRRQRVDRPTPSGSRTASSAAAGESPAAGRNHAAPRNARRQKRSRAGATGTAARSRLTRSA